MLGYKREAAAMRRSARLVCRAMVSMTTCLCATNAVAQGPLKVCESVEIRSAMVSTPLEPWTPDAQIATPPSTQISGGAKSQSQDVSSRPLMRIVALGPVLGAMDSLKLALD